MKARALVLVPVLLVLLPSSGRAHSVSEMAVQAVRENCAAWVPGDFQCQRIGDLTEGAFGGLKRAGGGVTLADYRDDASGTVEVADFYFASRVMLLRDGQTVTFGNANPIGGNRHSVTSSDWGGGEPVLPVPGATFGGGAAFKRALQPGEQFSFGFDIAAMPAESYVALPENWFLVPYHCYIHGAAQMSAYVLVERA